MCMRANLNESSLSSSMSLTWSERQCGSVLEPFQTVRERCLIICSCPKIGFMKTSG